MIETSVRYELAVKTPTLLLRKKSSKRVAVRAPRMEGSEVHAGTPHPGMRRGSSQLHSLLHAIIVLSLRLPISSAKPR